MAQSIIILYIAVICILPLAAFLAIAVLPSIMAKKESIVSDKSTLAIDEKTRIAYSIYMLNARNNVLSPASQRIMADITEVLELPNRVTVDPYAITRMSCPLEDGSTQLAWGVVQAFATAGKARWMAQGRR